MYNDPSASNAAVAKVKELVFKSAGFERSDPSWLSKAKLFRPEAPVEHMDARVRLPHDD